MTSFFQQLKTDLGRYKEWDPQLWGGPNRQAPFFTENRVAYNQWLTYPAGTGITGLFLPPHVSLQLLGADHGFLEVPGPVYWPNVAVELLGRWDLPQGGACDEFGVASDCGTAVTWQWGTSRSEIRELRFVRRQSWTKFLHDHPRFTLRGMDFAVNTDVLMEDVCRHPEAYQRYRCSCYHQHQKLLTDKTPGFLGTDQKCDPARDMVPSGGRVARTAADCHTEIAARLANNTLTLGDTPYQCRGQTFENDVTSTTPLKAKNSGFPVGAVVGWGLLAVQGVLVAVTTFR